MATREKYLICAVLRSEEGGDLEWQALGTSPGTAIDDASKAGFPPTTHQVEIVFGPNGEEWLYDGPCEVCKAHSFWEDGSSSESGVQLCAPCVEENAKHHEG